ncbi:MAG: hypothetical protein JXA10_03375, partial [Anaerolineae bacterium]|nr:hypothetical protein [Anaerolineae bacterium]
MARQARSRPQSDTQAQPQSTDPQYEWAMTSNQRPVHITYAVRGETYICPVCNGRMIAKLGDVKQHHFAHETVQTCSPARVTQIVAQYWLVEELQLVLAARRSLIMTWPCPLCQQVHTANLLHDVETLKPNHEHDGITSDVALLDRSDKVRAVVLLDAPSSEALITYTARKIVTIVVDLTNTRQRLHDLTTLLAGARIYGGLCTTQDLAAENGIITDPELLRKVLTEVVAQPPHNLHGPLVHYKGLTHVFLLDDKRLWLPPILWQRAIGGLLHSINPALQVITQEWPQADGA